MDVTNPGLVNVANQVYGNPSVAVSSLAVPEDTDALVPVADQGSPPAKDITATRNTAGPTPSNELVSQQPPASPSQFRGEFPGVPPQFLPSPQNNLTNTVEQQNIPQSQTSEFSVAAGTTIQTNQNASTQRDYTVTQVLDADTGLPPVIPTPILHGTFSSVQNTVPTVTAVSPAPLTGLSGGDVVAITGSPPSPYDGPQQVGNVLSLAGNFDIAISHGPKTTLGSASALPAGIASAKRIQISGSSVPAYNGNRSISSITSMAGSIAAVASAGAGLLSVVATAPTGLVDNQLINLSGTAGYDGFYTVNAGSVVDLNGSYSSVSDAGGGVVTVHILGSTAGLAAGQLVAIAGTAYNGIFAIANVTANSFDITPPGGFVGSDTGNWSAYTFIIAATYAAPSAGGWASNTFDIDAAFSATATGAWSIYTFEFTAAYSATASGSWSRVEPISVPTTRLKLFVAPADLQSFGISLLGRVLTFDSNILTAADRKATRPITYFAQNYVIINVNEPDDTVIPALAIPQPGDTFFIYIQRENSEAFSDTNAASEDVTIFPSPHVNVPNAPQGLASMGNVDVSVGPQPNQPIITSGVQVPTAINVNVADQATSVGIPMNVYV